jgi:hypothetical protein
MQTSPTSSQNTPPPALVAAFKHAQERIRELEAFIRWENETFILSQCFS